jgi:hypothetical protein
MTDEVLALPDIATEINQAHEVYVEARMSSLEKALRVGELLVTVKESDAVKHGEWGGWVERFLDFSHQTARRYMQLWRERDRLLAHEGDDPTITGALKLLSADQRQERAEARERAIAESRQSGPVVAELQRADATAFCRRLGGQADLLFTDPPYSTDVPDDFSAWLSGWLGVALDTVKPTGRAFICCGAYPQELRAYLSALALPGPLALQDILVWTYRNVIGPKTRGFRLNWQAILHLAGPEAPPLQSPNLTDLFAVLDINAPDGRQGNRYHPWQKPDELAELLVRLTTEPGQLVIDPFCGTGTFCLVAAEMGRDAKGCDIDEDALEIAKRRGGHRV